MIEVPVMQNGKMARLALVEISSIDCPFCGTMLIDKLHGVKVGDKCDMCNAKVVEIHPRGGS